MVPRLVVALLVVLVMSALVRGGDMDMQAIAACRARHQGGRGG
jgi:hypothetical protein